MNFLSIVVLISTFVFFARCNEVKENSQETVEEETISIPSLIGFPQNGDRVDTTQQLESIAYPLIISDLHVIFFDSLTRQPSFFRNDTLEFSCAGDIDVIVDPEQVFKGKFLETRFIQLGTSDETGKYTPSKPYIPPHDSVLKLPVFMVNTSDSNQLLLNHDGRLILIQEALNENGEWTPIEFFRFNWCGNSYGEYLLEKDKVLMFAVNKYAGDFKTKLRVRLKNYDKTLFSNEYDGEINREQLKLRQTEYGVEWHEYLTPEKDNESI